MKGNIAACGEMICDLLSVMVALTRILNFPVRKRRIRHWLAAIVLVAGSVLVFLDYERKWYSFIWITVILINVNLLIIEKTGARLLICISMICWVASVNILFSVILEVLPFCVRQISVFEVPGSAIATAGTLLLFCILASYADRVTKGEKYVIPLFYYVVMIVFLSADILAVALFNCQLKKANNMLLMLPVLVVYIGMILETMVLISFAISKYRYKQLSMSNAECLVVQEKHYQRLKAMDEETRKLRHDMKNHLRAVRVLIRENKTEELCSYIEGLEAKIETAACSIRVNNDIVDAIVNEAAEKAEEEGIKFHVKGRLPIECHIQNIDLCIIFSNLLTNAVEACERIQGDREISLEIRVYQDEIFIVQCNTRPADKAIAKTWKPDKRNHGFGLRNIRESVEKYNGKVSIWEEKELFCLHILLKNEELVENRRK